MTATHHPNGIRAPILDSSGTITAAITDLTDSTGGTASDTIADTAGAAPTTAEFENAVASLVAKINAINAALKAAQITDT